LTESETNATLQYVLEKYDQIELKIIGQLVSIYGMRLTYDDNNDEEELNIHFKYIDNTEQDIIQNCVFVIYHRSKNECDLIQTICNTFLPITPRPLLKRNDLRVCNDNDTVQLVEREEFEKETTEATPSSSTTSSTTSMTEVEHVVDDDDDDDDAIILDNPVNYLINGTRILAINLKTSLALLKGS
uniref:Uncharacterized protein n=1 Tax=Glossina brevipalpis TaxID=37001 RepID=A0A1A9WNF4_9MUSC